MTGWREMRSAGWWTALNEMEGTDIVWSNYYWVYEMAGEKAIQYRDPFPEVVYGKKYRFEDIADKTFIKMHSMTIREELARQAGGRSMKTAITLMWNLSCIPSLG